MNTLTSPVEDLCARLLQLAYQGAQRIVPLGGASGSHSQERQDAIEPLRRMCKWIVEEFRADA